jgi:pimeloyl-ACP methyl ester carboxylesterase
LLNDAEAVVDWALNVAQISPDRIVLLGHSLGTAVATGIAHRYINFDTPVQFAGLILCAAFTNTGNAFSSYSIADVLPILAPVKMIPSLQRWFSKRMRDTWETSNRLSDLARQSSEFQLVLVHAEDDMTMPWNHTEELFKSTLKAAKEGRPSDDEVLTKVNTIDLGEAGRQEVWRSGKTSISKLIAKHGGIMIPTMLGCAFDANFHRPQYHDEVVADFARGLAMRRTCQVVDTRIALSTLYKTCIPSFTANGMSQLGNNLWTHLHLYKMRFSDVIAKHLVSHVCI